MNDVQNDTVPEVTGRPPETPMETVTANCRPQPAIPAVLALLLMVLLPALTAIPQAEAYSSWMNWVIPVGIVVSCGLAIAAGFCSFAPQVLWMVLAGWGLRLLGQSQLPAWHSALMWAGIVAATLMIALQLWRVVSGRFVPTIAPSSDD